ncbi:hypothetical protein QVL82_19940, partial [Cellulosimicrobium funkei]
MTVRSLAADVPVQPGADEARRWLVGELAGPEYRTEPSLLERFLEWLRGLFDGAPTLDLGGPLTASLVGVRAVLASRDRHDDVSLGVPA